MGSLARSAQKRKREKGRKRKRKRASRRRVIQSLIHFSSLGVQSSFGSMFAVVQTSLVPLRAFYRFPSAACSRLGSLMQIVFGFLERNLFDLIHSFRIRWNDLFHNRSSGDGIQSTRTLDLETR